MADKLRTQQQLESLQNKYVGVGHPDITKKEWVSNVARDSYASYVGHQPLLQYMSIGMGQSMERTRMEMLNKMLRPLEKVPPKKKVQISDLGDQPKSGKVEPVKNEDSTGQDASVPMDEAE